MVLALVNMYYGYMVFPYILTLIYVCVCDPDQFVTYSILDDFQFIIFQMNDII